MAVMVRALAFIFVGQIIAGCGTLQADRERAELHLRMGIAHYEAGNYPMALREMLNAEKLDPRNPLIQNNLGLTYFMRERYDLAETHLRRALSLKKDFSDARNNLARVLIEVGRYAEAEAEIKTVLSDLTYPGVEKANINMGLALFNQKKFVEARKSFLAALKVAPDSCIAANYAGRCLFEMGDYRQAAETLDRAIEFCQQSQFDEPHYYSAIAWYRLNDRPRAIARFYEILKIYPNGQYRERARAMLETLDEVAQ